MEFAAAFSVLILFVLLPLINMVAIPIRMGFANAAVKDAVQFMSKSEKLSAAKQILESGSRLQARLSAITGVSLKSAQLSLTASGKAGTQSFNGAVPADWLPDGKNGPCRYSLVLDCRLDISPLFMISMGELGVPGLSEPFDAHMVESCAWENLSKDPQSKEFYLNE